MSTREQIVKLAKAGDIKRKYFGSIALVVFLMSAASQAKTCVLEIRTIEGAFHSTLACDGVKSSELNVPKKGEFAVELSNAIARVESVYRVKLSGSCPVHLSMIPSRSSEVSDARYALCTFTD